MHQSFVKIYILVLVIFAVEKSDCKQGGNQAQLSNIEDIDFYYGAACLRYGHSCWGAHGKRNDVPSYPYTELLQQVMQKPTNKDSSIDENQSQKGDVPTYFNIYKTYKQRNLEKTTSDGSVSNWNTNSEYDTPNDRYYEDQELYPRMAYKLLKI